MLSREDKNKRVCYGCGSSKTGLTSKGFERWFINKPTSLVLCSKCYSSTIEKEMRRLVYERKPERRKRTVERIRLYARHKRVINFKDRLVLVPYEPRVGVCNWCRAVMPFDTKATQFHHDDERYDENNVLRYGIEICVECHGKHNKEVGLIHTEKGVKGFH